MYSLRYGTIPLVRETGGLKDTVTELDRKGRNGNGFTFEPYTSEALTAAVKRAIEFFSDSKAVERTRKRIMTEDHSWKRSAEEYLDVYRRATGRTGMRLTTL